MELKNNIVSIIFNHYLNSSDFNGLNLLYLLDIFRQDDIVIESIIDLIRENKIALISSEHDTNPFIIRVGFCPISEQINSLRHRADNYTICLYPTTEYLKKNYTFSEDDNKKPFLRMLKLGFPQYKCLFFEWDILFKYCSDPRYIFKFNDYCGEISSSKDVDLRSFINLRTFGVGKKNLDDFVVVAFPKDLNKMSISCQNEWYGKLVSEQDKCKVLQNYYENQLCHCWNFPNTI